MRGQKATCLTYVHLKIVVFERGIFSIFLVFLGFWKLFSDLKQSRGNGFEKHLLTLHFYLQQLPYRYLILCQARNWNKTLEYLWTGCELAIVKPLSRLHVQAFFPPFQPYFIFSKYKYVHVMLF